MAPRSTRTPCTGCSAPALVGKVRHNDDLFLGEHEPIIEPDVFERVQRTLCARQEPARDARDGASRC